jgi:hypothetical protein
MLLTERVSVGYAACSAAPSSDRPVKVNTIAYNLLQFRYKTVNNSCVRSDNILAPFFLPHVVVTS